MEVERRRLVLEFFIPHFIAMARSSEKFDALRQAVIYLEQAQRLCYLLREEPAGDGTANEYLDVIRDKLSDCQRKLVNQGGYKLPPRDKLHMGRNLPSNFIRKQRPKCEHVINQDSPIEGGFTLADIHIESNFNQEMKKYLDINGTEESKL